MLLFILFVAELLNFKFRQEWPVVGADEVSYLLHFVIGLKHEHRKAIFYFLSMLYEILPDIVCIKRKGKLLKRGVAYIIQALLVLL